MPSRLEPALGRAGRRKTKRGFDGAKRDGAHGTAWTASFESPSLPPLAVLHVAVIAVHVVFGAAWFGLAIALSILSKEALRSESRGAASACLAVATSMSGASVMFYGFAVLNVVLGTRVGAVYGWPYHAALGLGLLLLIVQFALVRPGAAALARHLGTPLGHRGRVRLGAGLGLGQGAWFAMVVLMYVHRLGAL